MGDLAWEIATGGGQPVVTDTETQKQITAFETAGWKVVPANGWNTINNVIVDLRSRAGATPEVTEMLKAIPVPKAAAEGVIDYTELKAWVKAQMADWPFARGALDEFLVLWDLQLNGADKAMLKQFRDRFETIWQASQTEMNEEQLGAFLVLELTFVIRSTVAVIQRLLPQLAQRIPLFFLGGVL